MGKNNHRSGKKIGGRHTTVIDAAQPVVDYLQKHPAVTNIIAGHIKAGIGVAPQRLKVREGSGCLYITVRGSASVQELKIFSKNMAQVVADLKEKFAKLCAKK